MRSAEATAEARREMEICNACRYCEGFCAVFPAMELRRSFSDGDLDYLANLCHDCRGCFYACQYAPPHEFAINLPKALAIVRTHSYGEHAWPRALGAAFAQNGTVVSVTTALAIAGVLLAAAALSSPTTILARQLGPGAFYRVIPESAMTGVALAALLFSVIALTIGARRFWQHSGAGVPVTTRALRRAFADALTLRNLGGGDDAGCNERDEAFSLSRRRYHHALVIGFAICFASTIVAAIYDHLLGRPAPYALLSAPVVLGTVGGGAMLVGAFGLLGVKLSADPEPASRALRGGEYALLVQLILASATGLLLLALRQTTAMTVLLAIHLGVILSFFVTMPYGKFVHGIYRTAALVRSAQEHQQEPLALTHR